MIQGSRMTMPLEAADVLRAARIFVNESPCDSKDRPYIAEIMQDEFNELVKAVRAWEAYAAKKD